MKELNIILVYDKEKENILMCKRTKEPYKGKFNLVGGKIEENENHIDAAYRELEEETNITKHDITLIKLMDFKYEISEICLEVYMGILNKDVDLIDEINPLSWIDVKENFFDMEKFAGEGNIGHIVEQSKLFNQLL